MTDVEFHTEPSGDLLSSDKSSCSTGCFSNRDFTDYVGKFFASDGDGGGCRFVERDGIGFFPDNFQKSASYRRGEIGEIDAEKCGFPREIFGTVKLSCLFSGM